MTKTNSTPVEAVVIEALPNIMFRLRMNDDKEVIAYLAGRMRVNKVRVIVGDKVLVELDKYGGKSTNRITYRL